MKSKNIENATGSCISRLAWSLEAEKKFQIGFSVFRKLWNASASAHRRFKLNASITQLKLGSTASYVWALAENTSTSASEEKVTAYLVRVDQLEKFVILNFRKRLLGDLDVLTFDGRISKCNPIIFRNSEAGDFIRLANAIENQ